jgi:succinate dehydrogenase flavin-adding protein (antitoxin of CptAB toxin-antitoxin module)
LSFIIVYVINQAASKVYIKMIDTLKRKMIYWSKHRGCKEMDLFLPNFVVNYVKFAQDADLLILEQFLQENELDISNWILASQLPPKKYTNLIKEILIFNSRD